jgi:hypothetical protein
MASEQFKNARCETARIRYVAFKYMSPNINFLNSIFKDNKKVVPPLFARISAIGAILGGKKFFENR